MANYANFERRGFYISGIFDTNPRLVGVSIRGIEIRDTGEIKDFIKENSVDIAALTLPRKETAKVASDLADWGIKGIWNFAPVDLNLPKDVVVEHVHLAESLMKLSYRLSSDRDNGK